MGGFYTSPSKNKVCCLCKSPDVVSFPYRGSTIKDDISELDTEIRFSCRTNALMVGALCSYCHGRIEREIELIMKDAVLEVRKTLKATTKLMIKGKQRG